MKVYQLRASHDGIRYPSERYIYHTKREAVQLYKMKYNLTGKHNVKFIQY